MKPTINKLPNSSNRNSTPFDIYFGKKLVARTSRHFLNSDYPTSCITENDVGLDKSVTKVNAS